MSGMAAALALCAGALGQDNVVNVSTRSELVAALERARPGTTIRVAPGTYAGGLHRANLKGSDESPIVIAAADPDHPPVFEGGASGLHLSAPAFVELRRLVFTGATGNGLNIDDGGARDVPARHITLSGLVVRDVGPRGNRDGIKLSGLDEFRVEDCTVERWGEGGSGIDMVGCHDGTVVGCTFRHRGAAQANGVQMKGGSSGIVVQRCRFEDAGSRAVNIGGSTGLAYFRPRPQGYEARDITVEDCTFIGSMAPVAFVGVDGAVVRHNTIYRPTRWAIRILQENQAEDFVPSRNGRFENNIVAFRSDELRVAVNVGGATAPETFTFAGNVWHCIDRPADTRRFVELPVAEARGRYGVDPQFAAPAQGDLRVRAGEAQDAGVRDTRERPQTGRE